MGRSALTRIAFASTLAAAFALVSTPATGQAGACEPGWVPTFGSAPPAIGLQASVLFDDGKGPALFIAGAGSFADGESLGRVVRWDGRVFTGLGVHLANNESVDAIAVFDDGSGPALYIGGRFTTIDAETVNNIARWDGHSWSALGSGVTGSQGRVFAMEVFDDGSGPALYVVGSFTDTGGVGARDIARWNGVEWSPVGGGVDTLSGTVRAIQAFGPELVIAGGFDRVGGVQAWGVASWNGAAWRSLNPVFSLTGYRSLEVFDDGNGPALYVGGTFDSVSGVPAQNIARWDGQQWSSVGAGLARPVQVLHTHDDGTGPALYAGGVSRVGFPPLDALAKWDGVEWSFDEPVVQSNDPVSGLASFHVEGDSRPSLLVSGRFSAGGMQTSGAARWDGERWSIMGDGLNGQVSALAFFTPQPGGQPSLYVSGAFSAVNDAPTGRLLRWDGASWHTLDLAPLQSASLLYATTLGDAPALAIAGFAAPGSTPPVAGIALWDGKTLSTLGGGVWRTRSAGPGSVQAIAEQDNRDGPALVIGGTFDTVGGPGGIPANAIATWDGAEWRSLGSGLRITEPDLETNGVVRATAVFDDGSGPAIYVSGQYTHAGEVPAPARIARWDGHDWSVVGDAVGIATALVVHDDGTGPALYAGGTVAAHGEKPGRGVIRWNGQSWDAVGGGIDDPGIGTQVRALHVADTPSGKVLVVAGTFESVGGVPARNLAYWDGASWRPLIQEAPVPTDTVLALASMLNAPRDLRGLFVGGNFRRLIPSRDEYIARFVWCDQGSCPGDATGDGLVDMKDLNAVLSTYAQSGDSLAGDVTGDGVVNFLDLNEVLANFGSDCR